MTLDCSQIWLCRIVPKCLNGRAGFQLRLCASWKESFSYSEGGANVPFPSEAGKYAAASRNFMKFLMG